jgi:hypothetical protein
MSTSMVPCVSHKYAKSFNWLAFLSRYMANGDIKPKIKGLLALQGLFYVFDECVLPSTEDAFIN